MVAPYRRAVFVGHPSHDVDGVHEFPKADEDVAADRADLRRWRRRGPATGGREPEMKRQPGLRAVPHPPQEPCSCIGGHLCEPKEQKTQQSPAFGRSMALQFSHS